MKRLLICLCGIAFSSPLTEGAETIRRLDERYAAAEATEIPDFQKHVVPLLGRLGCNGRACHGSFQGQGGFRLSLFGYDFKMDHENLTKGEAPRVDLEEPAESLMLLKPTLGMSHKGGKRIEPESWQHRVLLRWIAGGAQGAPAERPKLERLDVSPSQIEFTRSEEEVRLRVEAVWSDGTREEVTPLCRFQTNDDQVATVNDSAVVIGKNPGDTHIIVFYDNGVQPVPVMRPLSNAGGAEYLHVSTPTAIDELVVAKLRRLKILPSDLCSDAEFLRRLSIDLTGTLPTADEVEAFLADDSSGKRERKIDELLERPAYAAWWGTFLCDLTGNNDFKLRNVGVIRGTASREWYEWLEDRVARNVPYDEIVQGIVLAVSRKPGESFEQYCQSMSAMNWPADKCDKPERFGERPTLPHYWSRQGFRTPNEQALGFAHAFLGIRIQCAECHKHPFDQWSQDDFKGFAGFFGRVAYGKNPTSKDEYDSRLKEFGLEGKRKNEAQRDLVKLLGDGKSVPFDELFVRGKPRRKPAKNGKDKPPDPAPVAMAKLLGGAEIPVGALDDPRQALMEWLKSPENPYFARAFVNRVWARYFAVGIVEPTDDLSPANPPSNAPLLDYLTQDFVRRGYNMKWLHREIANSRTYQLSWHANATNRLDERNFSHARPRRLPAEVAYDAIRQATAADSEVMTLQNDMSLRAIAQSAGLGKGKAKQPNNAYAMLVFGKSLRANNCDCDRSMEPSLLQTIYLQNDNDVLAQLERSRWIAELLKTGSALENPAAAKPPGTAESEDSGTLALEQQLGELESKLATARQSGNAERIKKLEQRLAAVQKRLTKTQSKQSRSESQREESQLANALASFDCGQAVRQAYLRTLGRPPKSAELDRGVRFIAEASSPAVGLRDLLWALLNTKEFIVNH